MDFLRVHYRKRFLRSVACLLCTKDHNANAGALEWLWARVPNNPSKCLIMMTDLNLCRVPNTWRSNLRVPQRKLPFYPQIQNELRFSLEGVILVFEETGV